MRLRTIKVCKKPAITDAASVMLIQIPQLVWLSYGTHISIKKKNEKKSKL